MIDPPVTTAAKFHRHAHANDSRARNPAAGPVSWAHRERRHSVRALHGGATLSASATGREPQRSSRSPTRVLLVSSPLLPVGGGFEHVRAWLRHIDRDRFAMTIAFASPDADKVASCFAGNGVDLRSLPELRSASRLFIPAVTALRSLIRDVRPHVVHSVFIQADIIAAFATTGSRVPQLSSVFGYLIRANAGAHKRALYRAGYAFARRHYAKVTAISQATEKELCEDFGVDERKVVLLRSGLDFGRFDPTPPSLDDRSTTTPTVALAAQLIPEKQADLFLRSVAVAATDVPRLRAVIAGDGPERSRLEALAADEGIRQNVTFLGEIDDVPRLLRRVDVLVCAARPGFDGVPRVVLEAMASGAVVVTANVGGVAEVVRDRTDGLVLDRPDARALAASIVEVLRDTSMRRRLRTSALERVRMFDVAREVRELEQIYSCLAGSSQIG